jgi:hypothetical protein
MHKALLLAAALPAAFELSDLKDIFLVILRLLVACAAAFVGWLVVPPLVRGVYRLAFHKPLPGPAATVTRLVGGLGLGVLVFFLLPLGFGSGSGSGTGTGNGNAAKDGKGGIDSGKTKDDKEGVVRPDVLPGERVQVEMIVAERYNRGKPDKRYYLIEGKEPPKTLDEVKAFLKDHKDKIKEMDIIIWGNSVADDHKSVTDLYNLRESKEFPDLRVYKPKGYGEKQKPDKS